MLQQIPQSGTIASGNNTQYWHPFAWGGRLSATTTQNRNEGTAPVAMTIRNLRVQPGSALAGSEQLVIALLVGGTPSALTVTLNSTSGANAVTDTTNDVSISAGDVLTWRVVGTGSPTVTYLRLIFEVECTAANTSVSGYGAQAAGLLPSAGTTLYTGPLYGGGAWLSTDAGYNVVATPGTLTEHRMRLSGAPGTGDSRTFVLVLNGVDQDGTGGTPDTRITISDAATTGTASFSLSLAAGDDIRVKTTATGTPDLAYGTGTIAFVSTSANRWNMGSTSQQEPSDTNTTYQYIHGPTALYSTTEADRELLGGPTSFWLSGFRLKLGTSAPGSGNSWDFTLHKNTTATGLSITITDAGVSGTDFSHTVEIADGDDFDMQVVPTSTPLTPAGARWAFVGSDFDVGPGEGGTEPPVSGHLLNAGLNTGLNGGLN